MTGERKRQARAVGRGSEKKEKKEKVHARPRAPPLAGPWVNPAAAAEKEEIDAGECADRAGQLARCLGDMTVYAVDHPPSDLPDEMMVLQHSPCMLRRVP